jgi:hypothetical protein
MVRTMPKEKRERMGETTKRMELEGRTTRKMMRGEEAMTRQRTTKRMMKRTDSRRCVLTVRWRRKEWNQKRWESAE